MYPWAFADWNIFAAKSARYSRGKRAYKILQSVYRRGYLGILMALGRRNWRWNCIGRQEIRDEDNRLQEEGWCEYESVPR